MIMSSRPTPASRAIPAPATRHGIDPLTSSSRVPEHLHLLQPRFDDLPHLTSLPLHPANGTRHLTEGLHQVPVTNPPKAWARAVAKADHRVNASLAFLWDRSPADALTHDALVEQDLRPGHDSHTIYSGLHLDSTTHYVWTRGTPPATTVRALSEVVVLSGVCLFSGTSVVAVTASDRRVPFTGNRGMHIDEDIIAIEADPRSTLAEVESTLRLGSLAAAVAKRVPTPVPVTLLMDSPYLSYPLYGLGPAYDGRLPLPSLARWMDTAFERHHRVTRRQIAVARAASAGGRSIRIRVRPELWRVALWLRRKLAGGRLPSYEQLLDRVSREGWLCRHLIDMARPDSPLALAYLIYVAAELRAAWSTANRRRLVVQVEDPREWRILDRTRELAPLVSAVAPEPVDFPMVALYPLSRFWVQPPGSPARADLYGFDPGHAAMWQGQHTDLADLAAGMYRISPSTEAR
ncbi:hypothetical protein [Nonomuraea sp. NPDC049400]|uniref:hypothetical protein n=1 Tax=Nonomuraea sp. NPDC049400 TaxID=3364352 RepID=UPI0037B97AAF